MADDNKDKRVQNEKEVTSQMKQQNQQASEQSKYSQQESDAAASRAEFARSLTEELKDQMNIRRAMSETDKTTLSLARQLQTSASQNTVELGNSQQIGKQIEKDEKLRASIASERAIAIKDLSADQVRLASEIAEEEQKKADITDDLHRMHQMLGSLSGEAQQELLEKIIKLEEEHKLLDENLQTKVKDLSVSGKLSKAEIDRVAVLNLMLSNQDKNIENKKEEEKIQKAINSKMGVTGALVEGVGGIMQRLGMRSGIFNDAMSEANEVMRDMAEKSTRVVKGVNAAGEETETIEKNFGKVSIMLAGAGKLAGGFAKALFDPLTIILKIADAFFKVDESATKLQQITGRNSAAFAGLNTNLASTVDVLEVMTELTAQTGMSAQNIFSPDVLAGAAELKNTMGLTAEAAGGLAKISQTTVGSIHGVTDSVVGTVSAFNEANRSAVSQGVVLNDVATAADDIKASFAGNPELLAEAASAARKIGLELSRVDQIASSLMDFESSIEAELEAQLLTGKSINMAKARELALNNDIAGLTQELFKNSADIADFGKMNRIQQEAQAKALGVSREELGKMAYAAALNAGLTEEQAAAAANVKAEDMQRMAVQEKLAKAAEKMAQAFAPMLDILIPVADLIGFIAKIITYPVSKLMELADSVRSMNEDAPKLMGYLADGLKLLAGIGVLASLNAFKNLLSGKGIKFDLFSKLTDKITGAKDKISDVAETAKDKLTKTPSTPKKSPGSSIIKSFNKLDTKSLIRAAGAMVILSAALYVSAKAFQEFATVEWPAVALGVGGMIGLAVAAKIISKGSTDMILGAAAIGILGLAMIPLAYALNQMANVKIEGVLAAAAGLVIFSAAAFALGALFSSGVGAVLFGAGLLGIMALAVAIEPLGKALTAAAPGFSAFGNAMSSLTMESAKALAVTGVGLIALAGGLISLSAASLLGSPLGTLSELAALAPGLATVGTSLTAIAAGLTAIALALSTLETEKLDEIKDLVMTTALAAPMVAAQGAITSLINGITGGSEGDNNSELLAEIKALRAVVEKGGNINMDGNKVGQYIMLSANKSA